MNESIITYKCKLLLTPEQHSALWNTCYNYTFYYNWVMDSYSSDSSIKNDIMLHNLVYHPIRNACPSLPSDYVLTLRKVAFETIKSQRALKLNGYKTAKVTPKSNFQSPRLTHHLFSIKNDTLSIASISGRLKNIKLQYRENIDLSNCTSANLYYDKKHNRFFLNAHFKYQYTLPNINNILACDLGEVRHVSTYNENSGFEIFHEQTSVDLANKYYQRRRELQSKDTRSSKRRLKSLESKQSRLRRDADHVISKSIISYAIQNNIDTIALEDLSNLKKLIKKNTKSKSLNRRLSAWSYFRLQSFISYKAQISNINIIKVNPAYTSQSCPQCGYTSKSNRPTRDNFQCQNCGYSGFADWIAALNIFGLSQQSRMQVTCS